MAETLDSAADSLSDYTKKLDISSYYTNGDIDRAKQMVAGILKDIYVIKGRYSSSTSFGGFIVFFNFNNLSLNSIYPVVTSSSVIKDLKSSLDWRSFEKYLIDFMQKEDHDDVLGRQFRNIFTSAFTLQFAGEFKKLFSEKNEIGINRMFQNMVQDRMGFLGVNMSIDCEQISSLEMELHSLTSQKMIERRAKPSDSESADDVSIVMDIDDDQEVLKGREVRLLLRGCLVLSPVSGREISLLVVGDRIRVRIIDTHEKAIQVARAFNAYGEDGIRPITGRIISVRRRSDSGYVIFVVVAKGIYAKIDETEDNLKIAIDSAGADTLTSGEKFSRVTIALIVSLVVVLIVLIILLVSLIR